jgi:ABC-type amino acid transport substrate-binding protein
MVAKDVNTGAMSGVLYDYINELGRSLDLKVEWAQELNFATYVTDINSGKYDIECTGGWPSAAMGKFVEYTQPIFYFPVIAFVRLDDTRFDKSLNTINDPSIKVVSIDNDVASRILKRNFPNAGVVSMPQMGSEVSTQLMMVATGKADLAFVNYSGGLDFIKSNPGKIKPILHTPAQVIAANISVGANENRLKDMLNAASQELSNSGFVEALLTKYEKYPGSFYRVAKPYQLTAN